MPWKRFQGIFIWIGYLMEGPQNMDETMYMQLALTLAKSAKGQTGVNPLVGAVVVKEGRIVGTGVHLRQGEAHAEVHALNMAGIHTEDSTVYVTLEPCSHVGRTPPCAHRLIKDKVKRVVIATLDPNPVVTGNGVKLLRDAGIEVEVGLLQHEARQMNEVFNKYITKKLPFITLKAAMTLDGKIGTVNGDSRWISGEPSRLEVHRYRHEHQAIMVGIGTVIADNPQLTTRMQVEGSNPIRIVVDSMLRIPLDANVIQDRQAKTIIVTTKDCDPNKKLALLNEGIEVIEVNAGNQVDLKQALHFLAKKEISSILVEGGATLAGAMMERQLVDKFILYIAPKIVGGDKAPSILKMKGILNMSNAITFDNIGYEQVGNDMRFIGYPTRSEEIGMGSIGNGGE